MIRVLSEQRTVYRSEVGRRARLTKRAAYRDAAWQAWRAKYPCTCESETELTCAAHMMHSRACEFGETSDGCGSCAFAEYRRKTIERLARWLMWRDMRAELLRFANPKFRDAFNSLVLKRQP